MAKEANKTKAVKINILPIPPPLYTTISTTATIDTTSAISYITT